MMPKNTKESQRTPRKANERQGTPNDAKEHQVTPRNAKERQGTPRIAKNATIGLKWRQIQIKNVTICLLGKAKYGTTQTCCVK